MASSEYLLSSWEADLNQLLQHWPLKDEPDEGLIHEIDRVLHKRRLSGSLGESLANRLMVAMSFLAHHRAEPSMEQFVVAGSSGTVVRLQLARAIFRIVFSPHYKLGAPIDETKVLALMADDKIGNRPIVPREGLDDPSGN